ncbi:DUF6197 family protein [Streptomyces roseolus]|uniref:DUF6197 family protein n=1 Tax=Streptomyces roseolus TaxID=67358 RepID=UPI001675BF05|nr:hypothetical protein [Streptomyces roseolus]GGR51506.1 hypothetical protein GCM10010282_50520 [Streptomyces roseolus]
MSNEIFAKAADIIESHGHCKFALEDTNGAHCARGALLAALSPELDLIVNGWSLEDIPLTATAGRRLIEAGLDRPLFTPTSDIDYASVLVRWNNAPERTGADVVALFRALAGPRAADIGQDEDTTVIEFEPLPETAPVETPAPAEPVPA